MCIRDSIHGRLRLAGLVAFRWLMLLFVLLAIGYATKSSTVYSRRVLLTWAVVTPGILMLANIVMHEALRRVLSDPANARRSIFVGYNEISLALARRLMANSSAGLAVSGFFDDRAPARLGSAPGMQLCGGLDVYKRQAVKRALKDAKLREKSHAAEQQVTRLTSVLQMLSGINTALVRIHDRDELLSETCRLAHKVGGYAIAIVALINPVTRLARPVGWAGPDYLPDPAREFPVGDSEAQDTSLMGRCLLYTSRCV